MIIIIIRVWGYRVENYWMMFHGDFIFVFVSVESVTHPVMCVGWVTVFYCVWVGLE